MLNRFIDGFRRLNQPPPPEDSVGLRVSVALTVMIAVGAVVSQSIVTGIAPFIGFVGIPLGFWFSWVRRRQDNWWVKLILTGLLLVAFGVFISSILRTGLTSVTDTQQPLAVLFIWVQVMHAFDVPGRRDLFFSLAAAVAMIAVGGVSALGADYGLFVISFAAAAAVALLFARRAEIRDLIEVDGGTRAHMLSNSSGRRGSRSAVSGAVSALALVMSILLLGLAIYTFMPRFRAGRVLNLPFSVKAQSSLSSDGEEIENPGISEGGESGGTRVDGGYFGFSNRMDLSVRGRPSDDVVMRVRADRPALWRGLAYSKYTGRTWVAEDTDVKKIETPPPFSIPGTRPSGVPVEDLIQTFYVEADQPNLVFGASRPRIVYFPAPSIRFDSNGSIRTPVSIDQGTVYSVVSERPKVTNDDLALASGPVDLRGAAGFLEVPESVPQRVRDLAFAITAGATTTDEKVRAIEGWLHSNTEYTLDIPPLPAGADTVDQFLFVDRKGFCEQIATAESILLRIVGVPSRLVAGYTEGNHGLFSGIYEVRGSDAHSWTEVLYPQLGWIESDPTIVVPRAGQAPSQAGEFLSWIRGHTPSWVRAPFRMVGAFFSGLLRLSPVSVAIALVLISTAYVYFILRRRRRRPPRGTWSEEVMRRVDEAAEPIGFGRRSFQTTSEFTVAVRAGPLIGRPEADLLRDVAAAVDRDAFGREPLPDDDRRATEKTADRVAGALANRG